MIQFGVRYTLTGKVFTPEAQAIVQARSEAFLRTAVELVRTAVVDASPGYVGTFRHSIVPEFGRPAPHLFTARLFSPLVYANTLEFGWPAGFRRPPSAPLIPWVMRVLRVSGKEAASVAFLIARAIYRRGLPARRPFERGWAVAAPQVEALSRRLGFEIAAELQA